MTMPRSLACRECGHGSSARPVHVCERCFGPLEVVYPWEALRGVVTRESIGAGPPTMWRYRQLLPVDAPAAVGPHAGFTPLVRARNLARDLGVRELYLKNDAVCHPTCSFKDRVVAVAVAKAREFGFDTVACGSTGNLAHAVAAHAAEARLRAFVFLPAGLERGKLSGTQVYGATLVAVEGGYDDVNRLCSEIAGARPWAFVNGNLRPYYGEGAKTCGFEIVEQLGWRAPDHVVVPCAGGSLLAKVWTGVRELARLGLVDGRVRTRMHAAQPAGCGPIVTMLKTGASTPVPVRPRTLASSLAMGSPADAEAAARAVRDSGGHGAHVSEEEIVAAMLHLARAEGIHAEAAGGVALAATRTLIQQGAIPRDESIVLCITGTGLRTPEVLDDRLPAPVTIRPTLAAFERAMADLQSGAAV